MKPGDKYAVHLNEHVVAEAVVVDIEDGKVTLDIPATRIVMGVKSSLTDLPDTVTEKDRILLGDDSTPQTPQTPQNPTVRAADPNNSGEQVQPTQSVVQPQPTPVAPALPADAIGEGLANVALKEMD